MFKKYVLITVFVVLCSLCFSQPTLNFGYSFTETNLRYPQLVSAFYKLNSQKNFWFNNQRPALKQFFLYNIIDSAALWGLNANDYHQQALKQLVEKNFAEADSLIIKQADAIFTDAAIAFFKDVYQGNNNNAGYDEISSKYTEADNNFLLNKLLPVHDENDLETSIAELEPSMVNYKLFKDELNQQIAQNNFIKITQLKRALNYLRWIQHFKFEKYIIVNIASASLNYYQADTVALNMRVIVGKPSTQTPQFAAYCNQVILYPYWNVPTSIALKELLPMFKRNYRLINEMNMQVLDNAGKILNPSNISWSSYTKNNFPYHFRQSTGCDNSLGVIKFNLTDPFNVYMHDTNSKNLFFSEYRYYSHGCIRIQKPLELANFILPAPVDSGFVKSCIKNQQPVNLNLAQPMPVFVIYSIAEVGAKNTVVYHKDVYHLLKQ
jgi:murein L,D-transpeptidase YcbB/YkuD